MAVVGRGRNLERGREQGGAAGRLLPHKEVLAGHRLLRGVGGGVFGRVVLHACALPGKESGEWSEVVPEKSVIRIFCLF